jgi:SOS-response transcriptional repressor LexA
VKGLSPRQFAVGRFIHEHLAANGFAPTLREIGKALGIGSTNGVNDHLKALEHKGYLVRSDLLSRSLVLTSKWFDLVEGSPPSVADEVARLEREIAERQARLDELRRAS